MPGIDITNLSDVLSQDRPAPACIFVLFGATGDLAARKIAPALYNLLRGDLLDEKTVVVGVARRPRSDEQFRGEMLEAIRRHSRSQPVDEALWGRFAQRWYYQGVQAGNAEQYQTLAQRLEELDRLHNVGGGRLFYLATTPDTFPEVIANLGRSGLNVAAQPRGFVRLVIEKPFGRDLTSARALNARLMEVFQEPQVFRIDHYLGKEAVQNLLVFRFANAVFEPLLHRQFVDRVEITAAEQVGMEGRRGAYYDTTGALRDMVQNHLLQLLALIAMEAPWRMEAEAIRDEKVKVLRAIHPLTPEEVAAQTVRGRYLAGEGGCGYRQEDGVPADSTTETFAALQLGVNNWRWSGVPFLLRTGKRLAQKVSQIVVLFRREPVTLFYDMTCDVRSANRLVIRIAPDEGISLYCDAKVPGIRMLLRPVKMDFRYTQSFESASPEAYEHLLLDAIKGDPALFIRKDEAEAAWRIVDSIRAAWDISGTPPVVDYTPLSWGPPEARGLLGDPYRDWQIA